MNEQPTVESGGGTATPPPSALEDAARQWEAAIPQAQELIRAVTMGAVVTPEDLLERAQRTGRVAAEVLKAERFSVVRERRHQGPKRDVKVDGWITLGVLAAYVFGSPVLPHVTGSARVEHGWEASAEARTAMGQVLTAAQAQCTRSEGDWQKEDDYALRSMAQTRAAGKAQRLALAWILGLAGLEYNLTPAEEMPPEAGAGGGE